MHTAATRLYFCVRVRWDSRLPFTGILRLAHAGRSAVVAMNIVGEESRIELRMRWSHP